MGSFILDNVKAGNIQNWIAANAVGSLKAKPRESWIAYLRANSGTGDTLRDLEDSFLRAAGANGLTLHDKWNDYLGRVLSVTGGKAREKAQNRYK